MTLLELAIKNVGFIKASGALSFVFEWYHSGAQDLDGNLSAKVAHYQAFWGMTESKAWRHLKQFRTAFPMYDTPEDLVARGVAVRLEARQRANRPTVNMLLSLGASEYRS